MSKSEEPKFISDELAEEINATVATLTRLGATLANIPFAFLPSKQRGEAKQIAGEVLRVGASLPRTVGTMLDNAAEEWRNEKEQPREDLGSRLRRERELEDQDAQP